MQVDAINGLSFTSRQHRPAKKQAALEAEQKKQYETYVSEVPNHKMGNATTPLEKVRIAYMELGKQLHYDSKQHLDLRLLQGLLYKKYLQFSSCIGKQQ